MQETKLKYKWLRGNGSAYLKDYADESIYLEMPLVRLTNRMIDMAFEGIPITKNGNPKLAVLKELYPLGPQDWYTDMHPEKQIRMDTCSTLALIWELFHDVGLFRKYKDSVRLSKMGKEIKGHPKLIALHLLSALETTADTSLLDGYEYCEFNNSLELVGEMLHSFGTEYRPASFYAEKYAESELSYGFFYDLSLGNRRNSVINCFEIRVMVRFFEWFGLVEQKRSHYDPEKKVCVPAAFRTTPLFQKLIAVEDKEKNLAYPLYYVDNGYKN